MPVAATDLIFYGSADMPESDAGAAGGAIDTSKKVTFIDMSPQGNVQVVSSDAGDTTQTVTVTGRDAAGVLISEGKQLNGRTAVAMTVQTTWERLLKAVKSATCAGDVAVEAATAERSNTAQAGAAGTITLDASASGSDDAYNRMVIRITAGTGIGQIREIVDYTGSSKVAVVSRAWGTPPDATSQFRISRGMVFDKAPTEIMQVRRIHYGAAADAAGGSARDYYEKIFAKNCHATLALTSAQIAEQADPSGKFTFGLEGSLNGSGSATDRRTAPGGITFDNAAKNVANSGNLTAGAAQGIWIKLSLAAGDAGQNTAWTARISGNTV